jgi:hypothetical protein
MKKRMLRMVMVALICLGPAAAGAESDLWLHVRVDETDGAKVKVNLPITMVETALSMVPGEHFHEGRIHLGECCNEMSAAELRALWQEIKESPDMTFVTVEEDDETVRIWKEAGYLKVQVREEGDGEQVDVRLPLGVVEAMLSGDEDELDLQAGIQALIEEGEGELVTVASADERVRVWVDRVPEAD